MKVIEVPVFEEDGTVKFTMMAGPEEAKTLLQFALNFLSSAGLAQQILISKEESDDETLSYSRRPAQTQ